MKVEQELRKRLIQLREQAQRHYANWQATIGAIQFAEKMLSDLVEEIVEENNAEEEAPGIYSTSDILEEKIGEEGA